MVMKTYVYDFEVTRFDWLVDILDFDTGEHTLVYNDNELLRMIMDPEAIYIGFNSKGYDQFIMKAICGANASNEELKDLNDFIIAGNRGWEHPLMQNNRFWFNNVDIMDDMQKGLSLKAIEGHLGMNIVESSIDFNIDHPMNPDELLEMITYCQHDVEATAEIVKLRKAYLETKVNVGKMAGVEPIKALGMTNAKLTAAFLQAEAPLMPWTDEREYKVPGNLRKEYIPSEVFAFFDRMKDLSIPDDDVFGGSLELEVGGCPVKVAYGGIHGAIPHYVWESASNPGRLIRNYDVASYYPHLMTVNGYTSRNMPDASVYSDMLERRMEAKKAGDSVTANSLKLVANTTYGATLNKYNPLYDPLMARSVCVSGQLYLLELAEHLLLIPGLKIVQLNTDGIMVEFDADDLDHVRNITGEWQERTGFELEEDVIDRIFQKDVNNYIEVQAGGKAKSKGGYLVRGIAPAGAFNINNNARIVATAIREYFLNGTPVEQTINTCDEILQFQMIAKAGSKYREAYHLVDGEKQSIQKVNRVYATTDTRYGKLYKIKAEDDSEAKIDSLPEHCMIDNDNKLTIESLDKNWYIQLAMKRIDDFLGIEPEKPKKERKKKMATKAETVVKESVLKRLGRIREKVLAAGIKKSGKNSQLKAHYFELDDIVPVAMPLFNEEGLFPIVNFTEEVCTMTIVDMDDENKFITFTAPMRRWDGNAAVTPVQALGATLTYMRRYLYQLALDLVEADPMDSGELPIGAPQSKPAAPAPVPTTAAPKPKIPVTAEKREEIKAELTAPDGNADELQIKQLKVVLKKYLAKFPDKEEVVAGIAVQTKGFTEITKADCEGLIKKMSAAVQEA